MEEHRNVLAYAESCTRYTRSRKYQPRSVWSSNRECEPGGRSEPGSKSSYERRHEALRNRVVVSTSELRACSSCRETARTSHRDFVKASAMTQSRLPSFLVTMWLLGTIASKSRVSDLLESLQEYEIVQPRIIGGENARTKRSIANEPRDGYADEPLFIEISNWTLKTIANDRLTLSSNLTVDWVYANEARAASYDATLGCDLRRGSLEGGTRSLVVATLCDQEMYVLMLTDRKSFFVQPLTDGQHVMYESRHTGWWSSKETPDIVSVRRENPAGNTFVNTVASNLRDVDSDSWIRVRRFRGLRCNWTSYNDNSEQPIERNRIGKDVSCTESCIICSTNVYRAYFRFLVVDDRRKCSKFQE